MGLGGRQAGRRVGTLSHVAGLCCWCVLVCASVSSYTCLRHKALSQWYCGLLLLLLLCPAGRSTPVVSFTSGAIAGAAATVASYPFDLLRTTLAAQGEPKVSLRNRLCVQSDLVAQSMSLCNRLYEQNKVVIQGKNLHNRLPQAVCVSGMFGGSRGIGAERVSFVLAKCPAWSAPAASAATC